MKVAEAELTAAPGAHATLLIVDDSAVNLQLLVRTLQTQGYRLLAARSGRAALDIAERARPDLVLLDVMMPDMDGFEVCRRLKASEATREAVVIFLSALGEVEDKVAGLELGACDYITKPIQTEEVLARVANHLARQHLEREVRRSRDALGRELASAGRMQRLLLPDRLPRGFAAYYQTSRYAGGDYYDVLPLPGGRFGVLVADVSGHGAAAAIVMAMIRAVVHAQARDAFEPSTVLQRLNAHFEYLWNSPMFATALCAVVDPQARSLALARAGHPWPLLLRGGVVRALDDAEATLPLLMFDLPVIPVVTHSLEPGDRVLFYTDGVTERSAPDDSMYEIERLMTAFRETAAGAADPGGAVASLVQEVERFASGREADDDQTLLVVAIDEVAEGSAVGSRR